MYWQVAKGGYNHDRIYFVVIYKFITWIYKHVTRCNIFWRNMLSSLNTLLNGALH